MNLDILRRNMVEQQIRTWDVLDDRILSLYYEVPRERFVATGQRELAFADIALPIEHGQEMLPPKLEARMLQELSLEPEHTVLHIGCGSGFFAALAARMAGHVHSVEIVPELAESGAQRLAENDVANVTVHTGNGIFGLEEYAPYDAIVLTGSTPMLPPELVAQLAEGGRLVATVGGPPLMPLQLHEKIGGHTSVQNIVEAWIPPLTDTPRPPVFTL